MARGGTRGRSVRASGSKNAPHDDAGGRRCCVTPRRRRVCAAARAALDALPVGYHLIYQDWRIGYANPLLCARLGSSPDNLVGRVCWDACPFLADAILRAHYSEAMHDRQSRRFLTFVSDLNGWFEFDLRPHPEGLAGCIREVTAERAAQTECDRLRHEVERLNVRQRDCLRDLLRCRTEGRFRLCVEPAELPAPLPEAMPPAAAKAHDAAFGMLDDPADAAVIPTLPHRLGDLRQRVRAAAQLARLTPEDAQEIAAAASEAAMNAFLHAGGGVAEVRFAPAPGIVQVWITDRGQGIGEEVLRAVAAGAACSTIDSLGQGLCLQTALSDLVYLLTGPCGTTVVLERERPAAYAA